MWNQQSQRHDCALMLACSLDQVYNYLMSSNLLNNLKKEMYTYPIITKVLSFSQYLLNY